jgi:ELWxxDGT repeat protein
MRKSIITLLAVIACVTLTNQLQGIDSEEIQQDLTNLRYLTNIDGVLYFDAADSLSSTDGTTVTVVKADLGGITHWGLTNADGTIFFATHDEATGKGKLWKSDGTDGGTVAIAGSEGNRITGIAHAGAGIVYYSNDNASGDPDDPTTKISTLYKTDGATITTIKANITGQVRGMTAIGGVGTAFFTMYVHDADENENVYELWVTDGTDAGTKKIKDEFNEDISYMFLTDLSGVCYFPVGFEGDDDEEESTFELWKSDGTEVGTTMVKDGLEIIVDPTDVNGTLFFTTYTKKEIDDDWSKIWKSDGTTDGTTMVKGKLDTVYSGDLAAVGSWLYFAEYNEDLDSSTIWRTDGSGVNTYPFEDNIEEVHDLVNVGGVLYYSAYSAGGDDDEEEDEEAPAKSISRSFSKTADADYTASLWKLQQGTATIVKLAIGSVIQINATEFAKTVFSKKPKVYGSLKDRTKENPKAKNANMKILTKVSSNATQAELDAMWTKKLRLYNKKDYKKVVFSTALAANPVSSSMIDGISVLAKEFSDTPVELDEIYILTSPTVTGVTGSYAAEGDQFTVKGTFFGSKPPKVLVECTVDGKTKYKKCKLNKETLLRFTDGKGKVNKSCMKVFNPDPGDAGVEALGYSELPMIYPKKTTGATGYIIVDNGISLVAYELP